MKYEMKTVKILLIEDNPDINTVNYRELAARGYHVLVAETLAAGREMALHERPDLIVFDLTLPDGDGLTYCSQMMEEGPQSLSALSVRFGPLELRTLARRAYLAGNDLLLPEVMDSN